MQENPSLLCVNRIPRCCIFSTLIPAPRVSEEAAVAALKFKGTRPSDSLILTVKGTRPSDSLILTASRTRPFDRQILTDYTFWQFDLDVQRDQTFTALTGGTRFGPLSSVF